jgi:DNA polymerase-3 subunit beta
MSVTDTDAPVEAPVEADEAPAKPAKKPVAKKAAAQKALPANTYVVVTENLVNAVSTAARVSVVSEALPSLANVRLHFANSRLTVSGTDSNVGLQVKIACEGRTTGEAFVKARLLERVVKALPGQETTITITDDELLFTSVDFKAALFLQDGDGFVMPAVPKGTAREVNPAEFASALGKVLGAISTEEKRPTMTGALFLAEKGKLTVVATDSYRMAVQRTPIRWAGPAVIVPRQIVNEVVRQAYTDSTIKVTVGKDAIAIEIDDNLVVGSLVEGNFVPWDKLVHDDKAYTSVATVGRVALIAAIKRVKLLVGDGPIRMSWAKGHLTLNGVAVDQGGANERVKASVVGGTAQAALNADFLIYALGTFEDDEVVVAYENGRQPVLVHANRRAEYQHLVMPKRDRSASTEEPAAA